MKKVLTVLFLCFITNAYAETNWKSPERGDAFDLGEVVVTPNRYDLADAKSPSNVTVVDQQQIEKSHATTLGDLLKGSLGLQVTDNGTPKTVVTDIRGFGDTAGRNVLLLVNGRRVNPVDSSGPDYTQIPTNSIERIEVIRGAGAVLYGDNAVGGVINIITKKGKEGVHAAVDASWGSYDTRKVSQEISGKKKGVDFYFNAQQFQTEGYRINSHLHSMDYVGRLGFVPVEQWKFDVNANWHQDKAGLPGGLKDAPLDQLGRRGSANPEDFSNTKDRMVQLSTTIDPWLDADLGHFVIDTSYRNRDTYAVFYSFGEYATKRNINSWAVNGRYLLNRYVGDHQLDVVAGVDYYMDDNWIYGSAGNSDDLTITKDELGLYANGSYGVSDQLFLDIGGRYSKAYYTFNQVSGSGAYEKQNPDELIGKIGTHYQYASQSNVFASIEQTYRFLSTDDWYDTFNGLNTSLNQQRGVQYQVGVKHDFFDKVLLSLTPYWINLHNEIFLDPAGGGGFGATSHYDRTRRIGVELFQTTDLKKILDINSLDSLQWKAGYTYQEATFEKGAYKGNFIPMASKHMASTGFDVGFLKGFNYALMGRYVGRQYAINDIGNILPQNDPYFVADSRLSFHRDNWEIFFEIDNLFNELYDVYVAKAVTSNLKSHFPAAERSFNTGVKIKF